MLKPNPEFLKEVPYQDRKRWADGMVNCGHSQTRQTMVDSYGGWCCLKMGMWAFGDPDNKRSSSTPDSDTNFARAMLSRNPCIAINTENNHLISAIYVNDGFKYTVSQICALVCPEDYSDANSKAV